MQTWIAPLTVLLLLSGCAPGEVSSSQTATSRADTTGEVTGATTPRGLVDGKNRRKTATDAVFAEFGDTSPGCAVGVVQRRRLAYQHAYGMADLGARKPLTTASVFDIASVSKQITAGVVVALVLDGSLSLEDNVREHLPRLPRARWRVSVADLVHHTSGLPDYVDLLDADFEDVTTADDAMDAIVEDGAAPAFRPGTRFEYSNTNYFLLGQIVEAALGDALVEVAADRIFGPLGMAHTRIHDEQPALLDHQARGYAEAGDGWEIAFSGWRQTGDGAVHTTAADLLRWARLFLEPPTVRGVGSPPWRGIMLAPGPVPDTDGTGYGGGIILAEESGEQILVHSGAWIGTSAALQVQPADGVAVAVLCNIDDLDAQSLAQSVIDIWTD